jgi:hypothetical protein
MHHPQKLEEYNDILHEQDWEKTHDQGTQFDNFAHVML